MRILNILKYVLILGFLVILTFFLMLKFNVGKSEVPVNQEVQQDVQTEYSHEVALSGIPIKVEFADTKAKQAQGLSGRSGLKEDEGMLFVFDRPFAYKFWMKDMNFAIDMIWFNKDKKRIYIEKNATPESYPTLFGPNQEALYVLETASGWSDRHNIKVGDTLEF